MAQILPELAKWGVFGLALGLAFIIFLMVKEILKSKKEESESHEQTTKELLEQLKKKGENQEELHKETLDVVKSNTEAIVGMKSAMERNTEETKSSRTVIERLVMRAFDDKG